MDFSVSYLNSVIKEDKGILMLLTHDLTELFTEVSHKLKQFVDKEGQLIVRILKSLYGLVQSDSF